MNNKKISTRKLATLALLISVAMILSYVESLIPAFVAVPGVKVGLSNIATVFALYTMGAVPAIAVSLVRVCLSSLLFGNVSVLLFSLGGACLSLLMMVPLKKFAPFSSIGVSVAGGVAHNLGQTIVASLVMENAAIMSYFVPLLISGTVAGVAVGVASGLLVERVGKRLKL